MEPACAALARQTGMHCHCRHVHQFCFFSTAEVLTHVLLLLFSARQLDLVVCPGCQARLPASAALLLTTKPCPALNTPCRPCS